MVSSIEEDLTLKVERTEGTGKRVSSYEFVRGREQLHSETIVFNDHKSASARDPRV